MTRTAAASTSPRNCACWRTVSGCRIGGATCSAIPAAIGQISYAEAVAGGAGALGVPFGIVVGASADLVELDLDHPSLIGSSHGALLDSLVFAAGRSAVNTVWRHGEAVVSAGRHHARERIVGRYAATLRKLLT